MGCCRTRTVRDGAGRCCDATRESTREIAVATQMARRGMRRGSIASHTAALLPVRAGMDA